MFIQPSHEFVPDSSRNETEKPGFELGSISTVSRVRSLILPEEMGDECGLIFPNSGWYVIEPSFESVKRNYIPDKNYNSVKQKSQYVGSSAFFSPIFFVAAKEE